MSTYISATTNTVISYIHYLPYLLILSLSLMHARGRTRMHGHTPNYLPTHLPSYLPTQLPTFLPSYLTT
jgi:hypothetical protein